MNENVALLKQEINGTFESIHDFAKWKLIVTAALGAAALGVTSPPGADHNYSLLLFIPFVCAYIDLYSYQYQVRILVLARFLRDQAEDPVLQRYERSCRDHREHNAFDLWRWAGTSASFVMAALAPLVAFAQFYRKHQRWNEVLSVAVLIGGLVLMEYLRRSYEQKADDLDTVEGQQQLEAGAGK
jgi:hypothetical protein